LIPVQMINLLIFSIHDYPWPLHRLLVFMDDLILTLQIL